MFDNSKAGNFPEFPQFRFYIASHGPPYCCIENRDLTIVKIDPSTRLLP